MQADRDGFDSGVSVSAAQNSSLKQGERRTQHVEQLTRRLRSLTVCSGEVIPAPHGIGTTQEPCCPGKSEEERLSDVKERGVQRTLTTWLADVASSDVDEVQSGCSLCPERKEFPPVNTDTGRGVEDGASLDSSIDVRFNQIRESQSPPELNRPRELSYAEAASWLHAQNADGDT